MAIKRVGDAFLAETDFDKLVVQAIADKPDLVDDVVTWSNNLTGMHRPIENAESLLSSQATDYNLKMNVLRQLGFSGLDFAIELGDKTYQSGKIMRIRSASGHGAVNLGLSMEKTRRGPVPLNVPFANARIRNIAGILLFFDAAGNLVIGDSTCLGILGHQIGFPLAEPDFEHFVGCRKSLERTLTLDAASWCGWEDSYAHFLIDVATRFPRSDSRHNIVALAPTSFHCQWSRLLGREMIDVGEYDCVEVKDCTFVPEIDLASGIEDIRRAVAADNFRQTRRIFIKRGKNPRLANQEEVCAFLAENGFEIVDFAEMAIEAQIASVRESFLIVAASGAELANTIFCQAGTIVIDLIGSLLLQSDWDMFDIYQRAAGMIGVEYHQVSCEQRQHPNVSMQDNPWTCPLERLSEVLELIVRLRIVKHG